MPKNPSPVRRAARECHEQDDQSAISLRDRSKHHCPPMSLELFNVISLDSSVASSPTYEILDNDYTGMCALYLVIVREPPGFAIVTSNWISGDQSHLARLMSCTATKIMRCG